MLAGHGQATPAGVAFLAKHNVCSGAYRGSGGGGRPGDRPPLEIIVEKKW